MANNSKEDKKTGKAKIQDIAKIAGVSSGTVSNALNNRRGVGREVREKILSIANKMGYNKNSGKEEARVIKFIIFKKHGYVVSDTPFFSALIEGIERECRNQGYELLITHIIANEHNEEDIKDIINQDQISGVLLLATEMEEEDILLFSKFNLPVILLDGYFRDADCDQILINNVKGAYQVARHLVAMGHKKIGILGSSKALKNFSYRTEGFKMALRDACISKDNEYDVLLEPTLDGAYKDMQVLLESSDFKLPTAYFALNDNIALGAIRALREKGIDIPGKLSIVGFDDIPICEISSPRLTTIRVNKDYIGKIAVKRLIDKISEQDDKNIKIEIDTALIERDSVKKL